jgi:phosphohistidine swiveling domain-containing protein
MHSSPAVPLTDPIRGVSEPGRLWTLTNTGEATPDILSPLCWSLWGTGVEFASRGGLYDFGMLGSSALKVPEDPNKWSTGCFFGRQAMNVDSARELAGLLPGMTGDDFERDLLGAVRPDATPTRSDPKRLLVLIAKAPLTLSRERSAPRRLHQRQMEWWRNTVLAGRWSDPHRLLEDSSQRFSAAMRVHVRSRLILNVLRAQVESAATKAGRGDLAPVLLAGYGGVVETALADDVWSLGHGRITLPDFLLRHGYHGPNEGNVIGHSWREDASGVVRAAAAHADRSESERPVVRAARAEAARVGAEVDLLATLPAIRRPIVRRLLALTGAQVRSVELTKAAFLTAVDGCRAAATALSAAMFDAGLLAQNDGAFYLTVEELMAPLPANVDELVAFRTARREEYRAVNVPLAFTGMPEPTTAPEGYAPSGDIFRGTPAGAGIFEGTVRVVLDAESEETLDDGEVLVCKLVDPGWTALVSLAGALVTDIGSPASHGAIVARELGIPCVVGTGSGTAALCTGDLVRVDGSTGEIAVLARAAVGL